MPDGIEIIDELPQQNPYEDKITEILKRRAQPQQFTGAARDAAALASQIGAQVGRDRSAQQILEAVRGPQEARELESTSQLYNMYEQQLAKGDKRAQNVQDAAALITSDPIAQAKIIKSLIDSPKQINTSNKNQVLMAAAESARTMGIETDFERKQRVSVGGQKLPAAVVIANEIQKAREDGDVERMNDLMIAGKLLEKGQVIGEGGDILAASGAAEALGALKYGETAGKEKAELEFIAPKEEQKRLSDRRDKLPKATAALEGAIASKANVMELIDVNLPRINLWTSGLLGQPLSAIGSTEARDLRADLDTIKANIGFDKLQQMRDASPTGGALGQVSERENTLLQSVWSSIEQSQSPEQLRRNLERLRKQVSESWDRVQRAYELDFGEVTTESVSPQLPEKPGEDDPITAELRRRGAL